MSRTTPASSRPRWSIGIWTMLLSVTAATLAALLGIHALGDDAFARQAHAASTVAQTTQTVSAADSTPALGSDAPSSVGGAVLTGLAGLTGDGGALGCALLALLCVVTLAVALLRTRGAAARTLDPLVGPAPSVPPASSWRRRPAVDTTALGISRI